MQLTDALDLAVAFEARLTFTSVMGGQVAALGVLHALCRYSRVLAFVDIFRKKIINDPFNKCSQFPK